MRLSVLLLLLASCLAAADITGAWIITSADNNGAPTKGELILKEEGGAFTARMKSATGTDIPLNNVRREGDKVTFQFPYEGAAITITLAPDGDKLKGKWEAPSGETAPVTCTRAAQPASTDSPAGKWALAATTANGGTIRASLEIKDESGKLSGALSTEQGQTIPLSDLALSGSTLSFKVPIDSGAFVLKLERDGAAFKGNYTAPDGATGAVTLTR
jgi:hypothetical protein